MKYSIIIITALFLVSCGGQGENVIPEKIEDKQKFLKAKHAEAKELAVFIDSIQEAIYKQDSTLRIEKKIFITTKQVEKADFSHFVEVQGKVMSDDYIDVAAEVPGRILSLKVKEGQTVKKGQLIAVIDLESTKKQMAELETGMSLAQTVYERQERLWNQKIGSEMQFLQAKNTVEGLEKKMDLLNLQLSKSKVYAPVYGEIERLILQAGELASPGMPIVQILNTSKLKVVLSLPETYLNVVKKGQKVKVTFPAIGKEVDLRVNLIGNVIHPNNRTLPVELALSSQDSRMVKPNLLTVAKINDFTIKDAVTVPIELVQQEIGGKDYIFVLAGDKAKKVYIQIGESYGGNILITKGLTGGETIIDDGAHGLLDGVKVEIEK